MRPGRRAQISVLFCFLLVLAVLAKTAGAHAVLLTSTPAAQSRVSGLKLQIKLQFNARVDNERSRLTLLHPDGTAETLELYKQESPQFLVSEAKGLAAGGYRLRWQVLASDGHLTRGEIPFCVVQS